jgi:hypothetical protein
MDERQVREEFERLLGLRVRPAEPIRHTGVFFCAGCDARERFTFGETACDCTYDTDKSEWVWSRDNP